MRAMVLDAPRSPLRLDSQSEGASPDAGQVRIQVAACGVCRTDLHILDGELPFPGHPAILGHEVVGTVVEVGPGVAEHLVGARLGVPWLGWTCGVCPFCRSGRENLCDRARFTGYDLDGGYAEFALVDARFTFPISRSYSDVEAAPLLCAGLIGFRALRLAGDAPRLGLYGFGAAAHIAIQVARHRGEQVYAFTRPGDVEGQAFARSLGVDWAGGSDERAPKPLDAAVIFAPVGSLIPTALAATAKGGTVVCAGIHMSDLPAFPYALLWEERVLRSVANLTRKDGEEFFAFVETNRVQTHTTSFPLERANEALAEVRAGRVRGAAVLVP
ncbi:MAG: zinc-dependent alcohol dehydrogenase family protein [Thermoplasmata archaeon]|nr:zinc-dependent alcohol dehydrogenase family protein [Thermoplasmata archaeon]